jgi:hypothetical protein
MAHADRSFNSTGRDNGRRSVGTARTGSRVAVPVVALWRLLNQSLFSVAR